MPHIPHCFGKRISETNDFMIRLSIGVTCVLFGLIGLTMIVIDRGGMGGIFIAGLTFTGLGMIIMLFSLLYYCCRPDYEDYQHYDQFDHV